MRAVLQRVHRARVDVEGDTVGEIGPGLVVFIGVGHGDEESDSEYLAAKIAALRVFEDDNGQMNLSIEETGGSILAISQFTLFGDVRKGRRPGFSAAAPPQKAEKLYEIFCTALRKQDIIVATGRFRATMRIVVDNDGPVTILLDSKKEF